MVTHGVRSLSLYDFGTNMIEMSYCPDHQSTEHEARGEKLLLPVWGETDSVNPCWLHTVGYKLLSDNRYKRYIE